MKKATMSTLFFLVFLGLSFGSELEPKENNTKSKPINKEFRENIIKEASIKFSNTKIDKYKEKTKDLSNKKEKDQKVEQSSLITNKPEKVLKSYNFNQKKINESNINKNNVIEKDSKSKIIGKTKISKKEGRDKPKRGIVSTYNANSYRCEDTDNGAVDPYGDDCAAYNNFPSWCGNYDDDDFFSLEMCCVCGGGTGSTGDDGGSDDAGADDGGDTGGSDVCEFTECTLTLIDSYGDGWNGNVWSSGDQSATLEDGVQGTANLCFDLETENTYTCDGGSYQTEVSWELVCNGELIVNGGAPASGGFGGSTVPGCTDPSADNYNSEATIDDGSCIFGNCAPGTVPCADGVQCITASFVCDGSIEYGNASWGPDCDDGSDEGAECCESGDYADEVCVEDCAGNILGDAILDDSGECCVSGQIDECGVCDGTGSLDDNGDCCESGYFDQCGVCDGLGDTCDCSGYTLVVGGGSYDSEITWEIVGPNDGSDDGGAATDGGDTGGDDVCEDTDNGAVDPYGDGCAAYNSFPSWCGNYDDDDFFSLEMCCVCGGGEGGSDDSGDTGDDDVCEDTDNGAVDPYGDDCAAYNSFPSWCGNYDDDDFFSLEMCCICGGGEGGSDDGGADGGGDSESESAASGSAGTYDLCLEDGSYTFNGFDSYGDGWNGATAVLTNADGGVLYTFILEGSSDSWSIELPGEVDTTVYGCTFEDAPNYNPEADADDGTCEFFAGATCGAGGYFAPWLSYPGFLDCTTGYCMYDLDGDGSADAVGDGLCSDGSTSSDLSCEQFDCDGGDCQDCSGDCLGTDVASVECWDGSLACSDDDCPEIPECPADTCELTMFDSWGDGWNGATFSSANDSVTLEGGSEGFALVCFDLSASNDFTVGGGTYDSEISWTLDCADGNPLSGGAPYSGCIGADCPEELTCDEAWDLCLETLVGTEYYEACSAEDCVGGPGGECDGNVVPGLSAECGAVASTVGSGECPDPCGGGSDDGGGPDLCFGLVIAMFDSYGDGWNGNVLTVGDQTFSLDDTTDGDGLSSGTACYEGPLDVVVTCGGGSYPSEVSWNMFDYTGSVVLSGGAPFDGCLGDCSGGTDDGGADDGGAGDCVDTDNGAVDPYGDDCAAYNAFPSWCGNYDDDDFFSLEMCCICGGGDSSGGTDDGGADDGGADDGGADDGGADDGGAGECVDTDNGAVDPYGDDCAAYNAFPSWCGNYDDDDFFSLEMCCVCGGGDSSGTADGGGDDGGDDCLLGDNNDDETINVQDIILVVNYIMGTGTDDLPCADMNDDGTINVQDIVAVVNIIMGISARAESATEATLVIRNNDLLIRSNGFVQGVEITLSHGNDFSINLEEEYVSESVTSKNNTKIILVTDGLNTLEKIGNTRGEYSISTYVVSDNNGNSVLTNQITEISDFMLTKAYPNPFNPTTNLSLVLSEAGYVSVKVYNIVGQEVAVLANGIYEANVNGHQLTWDASNVSSGVYIVRAESLGKVSTQKLMLLK